MPKQELLPGVSTASCPPRVACDAHAAIRSARRRAWAREAAQVLLLGAVDYLFVRWPESRVPYLDRHASMSLIRAANALMIADLWLTRAMPKWAARRIAGTWCPSERQRFKA